MAVRVAVQCGHSPLAFAGALAGAALEALNLHLAAGSVTDLRGLHFPRLRKLAAIAVGEGMASVWAGGGSRLPALETLVFKRCLVELGQLPPPLTELAADYCHVGFTDASTPAERQSWGASRLRRVHIRGCEHDLNEDYSTIHFPFRVEGLGAVGGFQHLTSLSLRSVLNDDWPHHWADDLPSVLSGLAALSMLDLSESEFPHLDRHDWGLHTCLRALSLGERGLAGLPPQLTALSRQLVWLDLRGNAIGDAGAAALGALRGLRRLSLFECSLNMLPLAVLALPRLEVSAPASPYSGPPLPMHASCLPAWLPAVRCQ